MSFYNEMRLSEILEGPGHLYNYFAYEGSLTTPNCNPIVQWVVFQEPVLYPTEPVLKMLRRMVPHNVTQGANLVNNYRQPQPQSGEVYFYEIPETENTLLGGF